MPPDPRPPAIPSPRGDTFLGAISSGGDHDWVRVTLEANYGYYAVMSGDGGATSLSEVFLNFRNAAGGSLRQR